MDATEAPRSRRPVPMGETDCFFWGNEYAMQKSGQGLHLAQTVLELKGEPDLERLRRAMVLLVERHPAMTWEPSSCGLPGVPPVLAPSRHPARSVPLRIWEEGKSAESLEILCERLVNLSPEEFDAEGRTNFRCDVLRMLDGNSFVVFTWRHVIFDGFGAELLVEETAALAEEDERGYIEISTARQDRSAQKGGSFLSHVKRARKSEDFFLDLLARYEFRAFSGPLPREGKGKFSVECLDAEESREIFERAEKRCGLVTTPYFVACSTLAHHRVWQERGNGPDAYLVGMPVPLRKRGLKGPLFQNNVTFMFFWAEASISGDFGKLCQVFEEQHREFLRNRIGDSFLHLQHIMRHCPRRWYSWYVRRRMKGEFVSFYHSNTGELAEGLDTFVGAPIRNGWHIPVVFNPPGTGLFLNQKEGRISAVTTWRDGVISEAERRLLTDEYLNAMRTG